MFPELQGKRVEIVLGVFDALDGEVIEVDDRWLMLRRRKKLVYVQIDKIRHLSVTEF